MQHVPHTALTPWAPPPPSPLSLGVSRRSRRYAPALPRRALPFPAAPCSGASEGYTDAALSDLVPHMPGWGSINEFNMFAGCVDR